MSDKYLGSGYRTNGYNYISDHEDRYQVYEKGSCIQGALKKYKIKPKKKDGVVTPGSSDHAKRYYFTYKSNFTNGNTPYRNQAHHLIPEQFDDFIVDLEMRDVLRKVGYDINRGENIIYLPTTKRLSMYHNLPYHKGSHKSYNDQVIIDAADLQKKLQKYGAEGCEPAKDPPEDLGKKFLSYANDLWVIVSSSGRVSIKNAGPDAMAFII